MLRLNDKYRPTTQQVEDFFDELSRVEVKEDEIVEVIKKKSLSRNSEKKNVISFNVWFCRL